MAYDLAVALILLYTTYRGAARGAAWQLAGVAALVLCFLFATPLSLLAAPAIKLDPPLNRWVAMLAIYLLFSFGCFALARSVRSALESLKFVEFDRHLGALFGFLKGAAFCLVATFFLICLSEPAREYVLRTTSGRLAGQAMRRLGMLMPQELDRLLAPYFRTIDRELREIAMEEGGGGGERGESEEPPPETQLRGALAQDDALAGTPASRLRGDEPESEESGREESAGSPAGTKVLLNRAAAALAEGLRKGVDRLLRGTTRDEQEQAIDDHQAPPAPAWRKPISGRRVAPAEAPAPGPADRVLVQEICRLLEQNAPARSALEESVAALLNGIPRPAARGTLLDWRADLVGEADDPDPGTDVATPLDARIIRQLEGAGLSIDDLPRPVRERLSR